MDRLRNTFSNHKVYGNYVAELSEPMFRQLVRQGISRAKIFYLGMAALILLPNLSRIWTSDLAELAVLPVTAILAGIIGYSCWPWLTMQDLERELIYRRHYGKWRWER